MLGVRVVFWDLRKSFLYRLYHGGVENSRLDSLLPNLDGVSAYNLSPSTFIFFPDLLSVITKLQIILYMAVSHSFETFLGLILFLEASLQALNQVCGLIDDALRDRVVSSIFRATLV